MAKDVDEMSVEELRKLRDAVYNRILTLERKEFEADCEFRRGLATELIANCFRQLDGLGISTHLYIERGHIGYLKLDPRQIKISPDRDPS